MNLDSDAGLGRGYLVSDEDYGPFDGFALADFERWLMAGMQGYFLESAGPEAFPGADGFIRRHYFLVEGLEDAYLGWNSRLQGRFRGALANALASLSAVPSHAVIFEHLLSLASVLQAAEILRVLPVRIGSDDFGAMTDSTGGRLFDLAVLTASRLSAPRDDATSCIRQLVCSRHFQPAYAGMAFLALCRADPDGLGEHLKLLRGALAIQFREYDPENKLRETIAEEALDIVGLQPLNGNLPKLRYWGKSGAIDEWFASALLTGDDAPLQYEIEDATGNINIWRRGKNDIRISLEYDALPKPPKATQSTPAAVDAWDGFGLDRHPVELAYADPDG